MMAFEARKKRFVQLSSIGLALAAGLWFFFSLGRLWPLAAVELHKPRERQIAQARDFLVSLGFPLAGYSAETRLTVDEPSLDYLEAHLEQEAVQSLIQDDGSLVRYQVFFKKRGDPVMYSVAIHPNGKVLSWNQTLLDETAGGFLSESEARALAAAQLDQYLDLNLERWTLEGVQTLDLREKRRFELQYRRKVLTSPEFEERLRVIVDGGVIAGAVRSMWIPERAEHAARTGQAPREALQYLGFFALGLAGFAAIWFFISQLKTGTISLRNAIILGGVAFICGLAAQFLQSASLFLEWDPLWPRWVSLMRSMLYRAAQNVQILLLLIVVIAAGDALDDKTEPSRSGGLRLLAAGRIFHPTVGRDALIGFLIGLLCGAALTTAMIFPAYFESGRVSIQPRGFFLETMNASAPAAATLLFFFGIALAEETGYRYFGASWLLKLGARPWAAILIPALVYGFTHTNLTFLPPAEPFWARPLVMTLVGCIWGWGFLKYGALAMIVSHFTADLFIFNWPGLASGDLVVATRSLLTIAVPLIPALFWLFNRPKLKRENQI